MFGVIIVFLVGILLIVIGIGNLKGNISTLHSYHRHRVKESDIPAFSKAVGTGTIIAGGSIFLYGACLLATLITENKTFTLAGSVLTVGIFSGLAVILWAIVKYNKGLF